MMNQEENYLQDTRKKLKQYIQRRLLLLQLQITEKTSRIAAALITILVIITAALFLLVFASITAGCWLAGITGSLAAGFGIVALFYLVIFLFVVVFLRKRMMTFFINKIIYLFLKKD
jgi:Putative Actinobacterial Holin-X, holin superfamily III